MAYPASAQPASAQPPIAHSQLMADAHARCAAVGERFTAPRQRIFELMLDAGKPLKAYDLITATARTDFPANPPTVYRALAFLTKTGLVHRIESDSSYVVCSHRHQDHSHVPLMLVCDGCGQVKEQHLDGVEHQAFEAARLSGFAVSRLVVEARGQCQACGRADTTAEA